MFSVPTFGIANTAPLNMPPDAFEQWVSAIELTSPAVAAEWREKRARAAEAQALREGNDADADDANGVDAARTDEPNAPTAAAQPAQSSATAEPPIPPIEPYDFDRCTITIGIQLLPVPEGGDPKERQAIIGVRNHADPPILRMGWWEDLATGFRFIAQELLDQLRVDLPARERACQEREAQVRAEEQTRQERAAQLRADTAARQAKRAAATKKKAQPPQMVTPPAAPIAETGALNASPQAIAPMVDIFLKLARAGKIAETPAPAPMVAAQQALF
jgi:hypothetical protein